MTVLEVDEEVYKVLRRRFLNFKSKGKRNLRIL